MGRPFEDREHLVRVALLFGGGFATFLLLRALLVPAGFGVYGHFRASALDANRQRPVVYAGRSACVECHSEAADLIRSGKHTQVSCEACHGALARHAEDPAAQKAIRPDPRGVCLVCHEASRAKPTGFAQVVVADHAPQGSCVDCHRPHAPAPQ